MTTEEWVPVVGHEGLYEVSDQGRIRSMDKVVTTRTNITRNLRGRVLSPVRDETGRERILLTSPAGRKTHLLSRLVLKSFIGDAPEGKPLALHNDGNAGDSSLGNLRWGNHKENSEDSLKHGTHPNKAKSCCTRGHLFKPEDYDESLNRRVCSSCAEERRANPLPPDSDKHGTSSGYVRHHCRCDRCKTWRRDYARKLAKSTRLEVH